MDSSPSSDGGPAATPAGRQAQTGHVVLWIIILAIAALAILALTGAGPFADRLLAGSKVSPISAADSPGAADTVSESPVASTGTGAATGEAGGPTRGAEAGGPTRTRRGEAGGPTREQKWWAALLLALLFFTLASPVAFRASAAAVAPLGWRAHPAGLPLLIFHTAAFCFAVRYILG